MVRTLFKWLIALAMLVIPFAGETAFKASGSARKVLHPLYVSVTEFNHNQKDQLLEISIKLYADDFENALRAQYKTSIDLGNPKDQKQLEKLVTDYIHKHLQLKINGKPAVVQWVGVEKEKEAAWCYFEVNGIAKLNKLEIRNNLLYEMFSSQMGIMHVNAGGVRKSTRLNNPEENALFNF